MKELTSGQITEMAIEELTRRGFECWRSNNIAVKGRKFIGKKGCADITGYHNITGLRLECEVKKIGDDLSNDQIIFLNGISDAGAHALIAFDNGNGGIIIGSIAEYYRFRIK